MKQRSRSGLMDEHSLVSNLHHQSIGSCVWRSGPCYWALLTFPHWFFSSTPLRYMVLLGMFWRQDENRTLRLRNVCLPKVTQPRKWLSPDSSSGHLTPCTESPVSTCQHWLHQERGPWRGIPRQKLNQKTYGVLEKESVQIFMEEHKRFKQIETYCVWMKDSTF